MSLHQIVCLFVDRVGLPVYLLQQCKKVTENQGPKLSME